MAYGLEKSSTKLQKDYDKYKNDIVIKILSSVTATQAKIVGQDKGDSSLEGDMYTALSKEVSNYTINTSKASLATMQGLSSLKTGADLLKFINYKEDKKKGRNVLVGTTTTGGYGTRTNYKNKYVAEAITYLEAADSIMSSVKAGLDIFGVSKVTTTVDAAIPTYKLDVLAVQQALVQKYKNLGTIMRGTKEGENVLYEINTGAAIEKELKDYETNIATKAADFNKGLDARLTASGTITTAQDAYLSQEAFNNAVLYNIHSQSNLIDNKKGTGYVGGQYLDNDASNDASTQAPTLITNPKETTKTTL